METSPGRHDYTQEQDPLSDIPEENRQAWQELRDEERILDGIINGTIPATEEEIRVAYRRYPKVFAARLDLEG